MAIIKIISGGQTGADQAGLEAGKLLGLKTGGTAPYGWITDEGPSEELLKEYGLVEGPFDSSTYRKRTEYNVFDSHGTVIFGNINSPGSKLTIKYCKIHLKPYIINPTSSKLREWTIRHKIRILNVAGNRERTNPGIYEKSLRTLVGALG